MKDSAEWHLREKVTQAVQPVLWDSSNHPVPKAVLGRDITLLTRKVVDAVLEVVPDLVDIFRDERHGPYLCCDCCPEDDPSWHKENPPHMHQAPCLLCSPRKSLEGVESE